MTRLPQNPADRTPRDIRRDAPETGASATSASNRRSWPVLARIGDAARGEERGARSEKSLVSAAQRTLRVDKPHVIIENQAAPTASKPVPAVAIAPQPLPNPRPPATATPAKTSPAKVTSPAKTIPTNNAKSDSPPRRSAHYLHRLPAVIRFAIRTWLVLSPYRGLIRAAVMFVAMALTGASTMLMMGGHVKKDAAPPSSTSAAIIEPPAPPETAAGPGQLDPAIQTAAPSENSTSQDSPTALGPIGGDSRERVAIESRDRAGESELPPLEPRPITAKPLSVTAIPAYPTTDYPTTDFAPAQVAALPYPVTPYPNVDECILPRVQTTDPPAVAKFEGDVESIPPR